MLIALLKMKYILELAQGFIYWLRRKTKAHIAIIRQQMKISGAGEIINEMI
ncbi:MAG: hypothetical protein PHG00_01920 [Methylococcales bacterium]|nr:hypothetical protein [Methylococcales bacterium]